MTTDKYEKKISAHLPEPELDEFRVWFEKFDAELWDKQLKQDVANGKLDHLADQ